MGRLRFIASPMALVDFAAILPGVPPGDVFLDLRIIRLVRVVRLEVYSLLADPPDLRSRLRQEANGHGARDHFSVAVGRPCVGAHVLRGARSTTWGVLSIPAAMWWSVMTLTTVGYGDIYPITPLGKFLGAIIALIGIGFFALPAGLLAAAFADELAKQREKKVEFDMPALRERDRQRRRRLRPAPHGALCRWRRASLGGVEITIAKAEPINGVVRNTLFPLATLSTSRSISAAIFSRGPCRPCHGRLGRPGCAAGRAPPTKPRQPMPRVSLFARGSSRGADRGR